MTEATPAEIPVLSVGRTLRDKRLEKNVTLEQAAQDTKIHIKFLRALEEERWADFPARVYMEGFFKRYAGTLGLDGEELIKQVRKLSQETSKPGFSSPTPNEEDSEGRPMTSSAAAARPLWLLAGGAALVSVLALVYVKMEEKVSVPQRPALPESFASAPITPAEPPTPLNHEVVLSAKSPVWVRAWVDDQVKFEGILQTGQNKTWAARKKIRVMTGNAAVVAVHVDGQPVLPKAGGPAGEIHWSPEGPAPVQPQPASAPTPLTPDKKQ